MGSAKRYLFLVLLLLLVSPFISCTTTNPVTGEKQFVLLSESQEIQLGNELYPQYTQLFFGEFQDPQLQTYVNNVGRKLSSLSHRPDLPYQFNVVNASEANAYALPGGKISITRGLIQHFENEAQLAAVLGHEIGHVAALHAARSYTRSMMANILLAGLGYYLDKKQVKHAEYYMLGGQLVSGLVLLKYSRDDEREADELGLAYMVKAGYDPHQFASVMGILKSLEKRTPSKFEEFFSSHPLTEERIVTAENTVREKYTKNRDWILNQQDFQLAITKITETKPAYALFDQGLEALNNDNVSQALKHLKDAVDRAPDQAIIHAFYGRALYESERAQAALDELNIAYQLYPDQFHIRLFRGMTNLTLAMYQDAQRDLTRADQLIPDQPLVQYFLGRVYEATNRQEMAASYYAKLLELAPESSLAQEARQKLKKWGYLQEQSPQQ